MVRIGCCLACLLCHMLIAGSDTAVSWIGQSRITKLSVLELNRSAEANTTEFGSGIPCLPGAGN